MQNFVFSPNKIRGCEARHSLKALNLHTALGGIIRGIIGGDTHAHAHTYTHIDTHTHWETKAIIFPGPVSAG